MEAPLASLIELFAATKQTEGRSPKTIQWYRDFMAKFSAFVGDDPSIRDVNIENARLFIADLQSRTERYTGHPFAKPRKGGLSPHTIHAYVRVLKTFSSWLFEEGFTKANVLGRLKRPKLPEPMIEILSGAEIANIVSRINPNCLLGSRNYLIVLLLLDTGIRAQELTTLMLVNTFTNESCLKVMGKGRKERMVPFGASARKALLRYLTTWRPECVEQPEPLLLTLEGRGLTYNCLAHSVKRLGISSGVPRLHSHLFRHTFAVSYLMNGGDVMTLKRILGHTTLEGTQMYMRLAELHVQIQHSKFSPVDRLDLRTIRNRRKRAH